MLGTARRQGRLPTRESLTGEQIERESQTRAALSALAQQRRLNGRCRCHAPARPARRRRALRITYTAPDGSSSATPSDRADRGKSGTGRLTGGQASIVTATGV